MDNLWHPTTNEQAAIARGNYKLRQARKRQDLERKAERKVKRKSPDSLAESLLIGL